MRKLTRGGGWPAIAYAWRKARRSGGFIRFLRALSSSNACKTCALGMGGQAGGMVDESGRFPEVCKKSMQAMAADMQGGIADDFFATYTLNQLATLTPYELEHLGRLTKPLLADANATHYRPISWDEALARCITRLKQCPPDQNFFYVSGRSSNEAGFLLQLFARLYGTNNVNNCSYYCHQASGVGLSSALGTGTATIVLDDLEQCDLLFLIGGNPASNHPRMMRMLAKLRRRGGQIIVINPIRETGLVNFAVPSDLCSLLFGSEIASLYVQPHIGGDIALLCGIAKRLDEMGAVDRGFVSHCTKGWGDFQVHLRALTWSDIEWHSGVDKATIERVARLYANARRAVFAWTMGITHHLHGVDNVRAIVNLAIMRGMVGKPGSGLLPIRGHSNVQGIGSVGVTPKLKQAIFDRLESHYGLNLPTTPGYDSLACIEAARAGKLKQGWCLGGNLFGATPDAKTASESLGKLDWLCYLSTTLNTGHVQGRARETLILPVLARDEEPQPTTQESMFNYVRMSDGGPRRHDGPRSEVELIAHLARGVLGDDGPINWQSLEQHRNIRTMIASVVPGYESLATIDDTRREFQIAGRTIHEPRFKTPGGKARFHSVTIPCIEPPLSLAKRDGHRQPTDAPLTTGTPHTTDTPVTTGTPVTIRTATVRERATHETGTAKFHTGRAKFYFAPQKSSEPHEGRAKFHFAQDGNTECLRLMTIRSEGQFNTVVYEDEDIYRHQDRRDVILMHPADIERLGLQLDQRVSVKSEAGQMNGIIVREFDIRPGNAAMYYPEANVLVPATADPESRTPAYKSVWVTLIPEPAPGLVNVGLPERTVNRDSIPLTESPSAGKLNAC
jgi:molybdopterin-dependent oxidoreductase alpha subunit